MAHELDELMEGIYASVTANTDPWHRLGVTLDHTFTAAEALQHAHLAGWNVRKAPITTLTEDGVLEMPDFFATVRTNPLTGAVNPLGVVGTQYQPIQNEDHCELLDALVDESGAHLETAGSLRGGRETFVTMKMPESMTVGDDRLDLYIAALNSHDGSSAFRFLITPVRIVCANTQAAALRNAKASFSIRHTASAGAYLQEAREALGLTWRYLDSFQAEAERMMNTAITELTFDQTTQRLLGLEHAKTDAAKKRRMQAVGEVRGIWHANGPTMASVKGTAWGGYQAMVEYLDHTLPVRGKGPESALRAARTVTSSSVRIAKHRAFDAYRVPA
jgi:phage/plasmid-like protein (TIGR03299 family)